LRVVQKVASIRYDADRMKRAGEVLGTKGVRATVEAALDEVLRIQAWEDLQALLSAGAVELVEDGPRDGAWRE
jgi:Arc/MetJ family transcription regulator